MTDNKRICLGAIAGAHGVRGEFKVKTFTDSAEDIAAYGPVKTAGGRSLSLKIVRILKPDLVIARAAEILSRNDAEPLKGERLYVDRAALPATDEDEFYVEDLIGLCAQTAGGAPLGRVGAVYNFGAGDVIELESVPGAKGTVMLPFTKEAIAAVDLAGGILTVAAAALEEISAEEDEPARKTTKKRAEKKEPIISDETGEIVSDDVGVDLDAMREEDA
ncbi:MAG: 16S rRNA processing protein RimM [Alphaproteobacteria bacterium]|nr:16S rRNA processing protein RimM [Alphaproteobacteria bacterium]